MKTWLSKAKNYDGMSEITTTSMGFKGMQKNGHFRSIPPVPGDVGVEEQTLLTTSPPRT